MSKIVWDQDTNRTYETGTDHGVLYPRADAGNYPAGVAWNGLTGFTESPSGAEPTDLYADNIKYLTMRSAETLGGTLTSYTYPPEFEACDGSAELVPGVMIGQQSRRAFGLCYRTVMGNDVSGNDYAYKLHLLYGCTASPSEKAYNTINDSPEAIEFSWEITTTPVNVTGYKPTANLTIDSSQFKTEEQKARLKALEDVLYGTEESEARLPLPDEVKTILSGTDEGEEVG